MQGGAGNTVVDLVDFSNALAVHLTQRQWSAPSWPLQDRVSTDAARTNAISHRNDPGLNEAVGCVR
jgi:hypothetical protein